MKEAQTHLPRMLREVEAGEEVLLTKKGEVVARIIPEGKSTKAFEVPDFRAIRKRIGTENAGGSNTILDEREGLS